jgi:Tfp pilus assembly protein PilO
MAMNVDLGIWGKLTRVVIALLVIALLGIIWQWYLPNIKQNERMRRATLNLDKLRYAKPGETVVVFEPPVTNQAPH